MSEINQEIGTNQEQVLKKLQSCFAGKIVRKDLTKKIKEGANVPVYVLEYNVHACQDTKSEIFR